MIKAYLQSCLFLVTVIAALFLIRGIVGLPAQSIAGLLSTSNTTNLALIHALSQQRADIVTGIVLLLIGFLAQLLQNRYFISIYTQFKNWKIIVFSIFSVLIVSICAYFIADIMAINFAQDVMKIYLN